MRYIAWYEDTLGGYPDRKEYYEIGEHGFATRQVLVYPDAVVKSGDGLDPLPGGRLVDQPASLWDEGATEITAEEFEKAWNLPDPRKTRA